jgi:hypothetical protein
MRKKYPSDIRNPRAAETLERLVDEAPSLTDEQFTALAPHFNWSSERWQNALALAARHVEFAPGIRTFEAFINDLIDILSEESVAA